MFTIVTVCVDGLDAAAIWQGGDAAWRGRNTCRSGNSTGDAHWVPRTRLAAGVAGCFDAVTLLRESAQLEQDHAFSVIPDWAAEGGSRCSRCVRLPSVATYALAIAVELEQVSAPSASRLGWSMCERNESWSALARPGVRQDFGAST